MMQAEALRHAPYTPHGFLLTDAGGAHGLRLPTDAHHVLVRWYAGTLVRWYAGTLSVFSAFYLNFGMVDGHAFNLTEAAFFSVTSFHAIAASSPTVSSPMIRSRAAP
jgi:hypothetical protein